MKKTKLAIAALLVLSLCVSVFCACAKSDGGSQNGGTQTQPSGEVKPSGEVAPSGEVVLKDITGVTFSDLTVTYDGTPHKVEVKGDLPQGVSVQYKDAQKTDAGDYTATATLSGEGYKKLVLNAKLVIEKAQLQGITFPSVKASYDGNPHHVEVAGLLPEGAIVSYSCKEDSNIKNSAVETGTYTITAIITHKNFNPLKLDTTLKITASAKERHMVYADGKLYFANALDNDKLYSYTVQDGLTKISSDVPRDFAVTSNNDIYFRSYTLATSSIKQIVDGVSKNVEFKNAEYLCSDGTNLYYAVNSIFAKTKGIYKIAINNSTETISDPLLLSEGKAEYLQVSGG